VHRLGHLCAPLLFPRLDGDHIAPSVGDWPLVNRSPLYSANFSRDRDGYPIHRGSAGREELASRCSGRRTTDRGDPCLSRPRHLLTKISRVTSLHQAAFSGAAGGDRPLGLALLLETKSLRWGSRNSDQAPALNCFVSMKADRR